MSANSSIERTLGPAAVDDLAAWRTGRPALQRVCAGEPLAITDEDLSLLDLIDAAGDHVGYMYDPTMDPDHYRLAEVIVEYLCEHHGLDRAAGGKRVTSVVSDAVRYLIPAVVEHTHRAAPDREGVAAVLVRDLKPVSRMLAGELPLPAATVAGDRLGRRGASCVWLDLDDAAQVSVGGAAALRVAIATGEVAVHADVRTGRDIVAAADLRAVGTGLVAGLYPSWRASRIPSANALQRL